MTCQIRPKIRCSRTSIISPLPILTTEHPMPFAEFITMLLFSVMWKAFSVLIFLPTRFSTRSSIVSGTLSLINLAKTKPSLHSSNISNVSVGNGRRLPISGSPASTALICRVNSVLSSSLIVCVTLAEDPWTCILPDTLPLDWCPGEEAPPLALSATLLIPRERPVVIGLCVCDDARTLEMSYGANFC